MPLQAALLRYQNNPTLRQPVLNIVPYDKVKYKDRIDIGSTLSQEVRFTLQQDTDALYFQDRPILQDNNTLLRPRYTIIERFYVGQKYVYTADIFIIMCICYIFML